MGWKFGFIESLFVSSPHGRDFFQRQARAVVPVNALAVRLWDKTFFRYLDEQRLVSLAMERDRNEIAIVKVDVDFLFIGWRNNRPL
jgi:hypothetical protein